MTTRTNTARTNTARTNTARTGIRRIAATAALSLTGIGLGAGVAAADQFQNDDLDIIDAPACSPFQPGSFGVALTMNGQGERDLLLSYSDGVLTCDESVSVRVFGLPHAAADIDHPDAVNTSVHQTMLSSVEFSTEIHGTPMPTATVPAVTCSAIRVSVGDMVFATLKSVEGCGHMSQDHPGDLVNPDPVEPEHPGDLVHPDPVDPDLPGDGGDGGDGVDPDLPGDGGDGGDGVDPDLPGDGGDGGNGDDGVDPVEPDQVPEEGVSGTFGTTGGVTPEAGAGAGQAGTGEEVTMLPTTGASTAVMAALAALLVTLGGAGMHIARREVI